MGRRQLRPQCCRRRWAQGGRSGPGADLVESGALQEGAGRAIFFAGLTAVRHRTISPAKRGRCLHSRIRSVKGNRVDGRINPAMKALERLRASLGRDFMSGSMLSSATLDERRRRILFRAWRRGLREMDLAMGQFADANLTTMSE